MRHQKNDMQILLIPGAIVSVAVFIFLLTSANSNQPSSSTVIQEKTDTVRDLTSSPVGASPNIARVNTSTVQPSPVAPIPPTQPTTPQPKALELLLPSEIASATPQGNGYVVTTTFGANWFLSQQEVESFPMSMKLRIDYGKYGAGAHGN
jgi:hypothetical protein